MSIHNWFIKHKIGQSIDFQPTTNTKGFQILVFNSPDHFRLEQWYFFRGSALWWDWLLNPFDLAGNWNWRSAFSDVLLYYCDSLVCRLNIWAMVSHYDVDCHISLFGNSCRWKCFWNNVMDQHSSPLIRPPHSLLLLMPHNTGIPTPDILFFHYLNFHIMCRLLLRENYA